MTRRGWTARLYPTRAQEARLNQWTGGLRFVWNKLLAAEMAEYQATGKFLWVKGEQPLAVAMKRQPGLEWLGDLPSHSVLAVCRQLDGALRKMVNGRKAGRRCGFPRFRKKFVREPSIFMVGRLTRLAKDSARLSKLGRIKLSGGVLPEGRVISARIWRDGHRWMLSAQLECQAPKSLPVSGRIVAIDLGLRRLATIFDGESFEHVAAPRPLRKRRRRLVKAQRIFARRQKGSNRRRAQALRVAALHRKVRHYRQNFLHQFSHRLIANAGVVKVEDLNVRGIARGFLAKSAADAALGTLLRFISYKAEWRGRRLEKIGRFFPSSQTCSQCGRIHPEMKDLGRRVLHCECGLAMDRDENAARNIFYRQEGGNGADLGSDPGGVVRVEAGCQGCGPVLADEARKLAA